MAAAEPVSYAVDDTICTITLNRPERRNAVDGVTATQLREAFERFEADGTLRVAILTGAGGHFCGGADLKAIGEPQRRNQLDPNGEGPGPMGPTRMALSKPLIAAVEGYAVAGGTEILQATDIRVAGQSAVFGVVEVTRGLFPLGGSTVRLRRQIPYTLAAEMLLTGKTITAEEALQYGLIGHVVPKGQALTKALEIADQIAANGPLAVKAVLRSLRETEGVPEEEALKIELEIGMAVFATNDAKEGPRAFAEKRPAQFTGT